MGVMIPFQMNRDLLNSGGDSKVMAFEWLPGVVVAAIGAGLSFWRSQSVAQAVSEAKAVGINALFESKFKILESNYSSLTAKLDRTSEEMRRSHDSVVLKFERAFEEMNRASSAFNASKAGQDVINGFSAKILDSLTAKLEAHDKQIGDNTSTITLIKEMAIKQGHRG